MLGSTSGLQAVFVSNTMREILPKSFDREQISHIIQHINVALKPSLFKPMTLNQNIINQTRKYLSAIPNVELAYIILKNIDENNIENEINLGTNEDKNSIFVSQQITNQIPVMFTVKAFANVFNQEIPLASTEAMIGNWVLDTINTKNSDAPMALADELRSTYVNNYIDVWESLLANIDLATPHDLYQMDIMIVNMMSNRSPLLQLLETVNENTYFEPIISSSPKLQNLGSLVVKNASLPNPLLYQIFSGLQALHQYIQTVLTAENEKKAAFDVILRRLQNPTELDPMVQLRLIAMNSPEPIKNWLDKIANYTWRFLMKDAGNYLDTSWREQVIIPYQNTILNRYPFSNNNEYEVSLNQFIQFFGNPGIILNFYQHYLQLLIDTKSPEWRWKIIDGIKFPFTNESLHHIQQALRIHQAFFPNGDNKLYVPFSLQPYQLGKNIKNVVLRVNDKEIIDSKNNLHYTHLLTWQRTDAQNITSIQFTLANQQTIHRQFLGEWGWFKLVAQSFDSAISKKTLLLMALSNDQPVKYTLSIQGRMNPFLSLNLNR